jgi:hypothetical protein
MWELVIYLGSKLGMAPNTNFCVTDNEAAAKDILANNAKGYVAVAWEHANIPLLVGWIMALAGDPNATSPAKNPPPTEWSGSNVFDQYWIVDFRSGKPVFSIAPQMILPGDCPSARSSGGSCSSANEVEGRQKEHFGWVDVSPTSTNSSNVWIVLLVLVILILLWARTRS